jgi:two-component system OmpR family sensor kinase
MRGDSFRVRLTVWNMAILALVLGGGGLTFYFAVRGWMRHSIDQELAQRVHVRQDWNRLLDRKHAEDKAHLRRGRVAVDRSNLGPAAPGLPAAAPTGPFPQGPLIAIALQDWPDDRATKQRASLQFPRIFNAQGDPFQARADFAWDPRPLPAALAGREQYSTTTLEGVPLRLLTAPLYTEGRVAGAVQVAADLSGFERVLRGFVGILLALLPLSLLVTGLGGLFLTNRALRPVHEVTTAAAQIGAGDLTRRLKVTGRDELAQMAATFNDMIARLEAAFEQQRRFTADASHELRTPLTRIKASASRALSGERSPDEYRAGFRTVDEAADAMERLIQQLLFLASGDTGHLSAEHARLDLVPLLEDAADAVTQPGTAPIALELPVEPLEIRGDADHLYRVFVNLLQNAVRHTPPEGRITVGARIEKDAVVVRVTDTGEGIPAEHLPHLGERFYRVDRARARQTGGSGLGLAISRTIVAAHGGQLFIESEVGQGTVVTVSLPRAANSKR